MDSRVRDIRSFAVRKMDAAKRSMRREKIFPDPYRRGFIDALAMVQSYIDRNVNQEDENEPAE